jgi:MFS family permease
VRASYRSWRVAMSVVDDEADGEFVSGETQRLLAAAAPAGAAGGGSIGKDSVVGSVQEQNKHVVVAPPSLRSVIVSLVPQAYMPLFFMRLYEYAVDPVLPAYAQALGCSNTQVGFVVAGMLIGGTVFNIPAVSTRACACSHHASTRFSLTCFISLNVQGVAVSRFGYWVSMVVSMLVCSVAAVAMIKARGFYELMGAQVMGGLGMSLFQVGISALLRNTCPGQYRGRVVSIKGGIGRVSMMVGTAVGGMTAQYYGMKAPLALRAALPLAALLLYVTIPWCCSGCRRRRTSGFTAVEAAQQQVDDHKRSIYEVAAASTVLSTCAVMRQSELSVCGPVHAARKGASGVVPLYTTFNFPAHWLCRGVPQKSASFVRLATLHLASWVCATLGGS